MEQDPSVPFEHGMLLRPHAKAPPQAGLQNRARGEPSKPGLETSEGYNPPEASDEGSGPHSSDEDRDDPGVLRFNAFGSDAVGWQLYPGEDQLRALSLQKALSL